jgi:hypothetical protein
MQVVFGYMLIILGVFLIVIAVLEKIGILKRDEALRSKAAGPWDVILEIAKKAPWTATIGIVLIFFGLELIGTINVF